MLARPELLATFRERLALVLGDTGAGRADAASSVGIDRSTLSQLLSASNRRLPRVETLVSLARWAHVSVDWLLGLSSEGPVRTDVLREEMAIERDALAPNDERLIAWLAEAVGTKIRYVPSTVPDLLKTEAVIRHELRDFASTRPEQKMETASARLAWQRRPETDMECCNSQQAVEGFALGEGVWRTLEPRRRREQLDHMADLAEELYPTFRWFLYDGRARYAAPVTIFGVRRAAVYLGQMYLVLHGEAQVRALIENFDDLIRAAVVQPPDVPKLLRRLRDRVAA